MTHMSKTFNNFFYRHLTLGFYTSFTRSCNLGGKSVAAVVIVQFTDTAAAVGTLHAPST